MTERLYYSDPFEKDFDATIVRVGQREGRAVVWLDRTAFYPTSGGQPFDLGTLGPYEVVDVYDDENEEVAHVLAASAAAPAASDALSPGQSIRGRIDWTRRFDHMQQHTGQHVLSAVFERMSGARTVSFHLGTDAATIDLDREVPAADIATAEREANRIVYDNREVSIRFVSAEEAARLPLRKEPRRDGTLRLIDIADCDLSACGGTHVARTGSIGAIVLTAWERFKGGRRVEFLCGSRAVARFHQLRDAVAVSVRQLSVLPGELPAAIERLQLESKQQKRTIDGLQSELWRLRADRLVLAAAAIGGLRLVTAALDAGAPELRAIAVEVANRPGHVAILASTDVPALVVVARSADAAVSARQIVAMLQERFGGRGGGNDQLAQAGGLNGSGDAILDTATRLVSG